MSSQAIALNHTKINYAERISTSENKRTPITAKQAAYLGVTTISWLSVLYLLSVMVCGTAWLPIASNMKSSDITLSLIECLLGITVLHVPTLISKITHIKIPDTLCVVFYLFVFCSTVLGEVFSLYYSFAYWDVLLHFSSGIMLGMFGSILLLNFLQKKNAVSIISPAFIAIAAVCFALCLGVVWEFYEFSADALFGLNMQKCLLQDGTALVGKAVMVDTMKDLMMDFLGGMIAAVLTFRSLKHKKGWLSAYQTGKTEQTEPNMNTLPDNGYTSPRAA